MNGIGARIKKFRKDKSFTQQQLADSIGKSKSIIQKYESNNTIASLEVLQEISNVLDVKLHALLYDEDSEEFKNFEFEYKVGDLTKQCYEKIDSRLLELNNGVDNKSFLNHMHELLEALDIDYFYDKDEDLLYVSNCYLEPSFNKNCDKTIVTNIDNFLIMLKNIISIRNNFFKMNKVSNVNIDEIFKKIVETNKNIQNNKHDN